MANVSDDDDAYLYGSDEEGSKVAVSEVKKEHHVKQEEKTTSEVDQDEVDDDDDADQDQDQDEDDEEEEDDEDESEDDIDIIIGEETKPKASLATNNDTVDALVDTDAESGKTSTTTIVANNQGESKIDVNKIAEYEGKPITQVDLETLKEKPWRAPGVDISDYFNYGFNEFSWIAYCYKQDKSRGEFKPEAYLAQMMSAANAPPPPMSASAPMPPMGMMPPPPNGMPPIGMMPPGFMPPGMSMANFPNMPNMPPGMPAIPGMPNMPPGMANMPPGMPNIPGMPNMPPNFQPPPNGNPQFQNFNQGSPPPPPPKR